MTLYQVYRSPLTDHSIADVTLSELSSLNILAKKQHLQATPLIPLAPECLLLLLAHLYMN